MSRRRKGGLVSWGSEAKRTVLVQVYKSRPPSKDRKEG